MPPSVASLRAEFRFFAGMCREHSPLYAALSERIAEDEDVLTLASGGADGQPAVNLLLGSVHYLLLGGARHPLKAFYASLGGTREPGAAYPVFVDFCRRYAPEIRTLVATRRVQTNEVRRCGLLLPAVALAWEAVNRPPLALLEIGSSAGLHLLLDRYRYAYSNGSTYGPAGAPLIRTELRGPGVPPLPAGPLSIAYRAGIDIAPVDVIDPEAVRWIQALIWPDQADRHDLFRRAVELARTDPPTVHAGDGLALLPRLVERVPPEVLVCLFHSHAVYQMEDSWRADLDRWVAEELGKRPLARISLEWLGTDPGPRLHLTRVRDGSPRTVHLADCDHHGSWIHWHESGSTG